MKELLEFVLVVAEVSIEFLRSSALADVASPPASAQSGSFFPFRELPLFSRDQTGDAFAENSQSRNQLGILAADEAEKSPHQSARSVIRSNYCNYDGNATEGSGLRQSTTTG